MPGRRGDEPSSEFRALAIVVKALGFWPLQSTINCAAGGSVAGPANSSAPAANARRVFQAPTKRGPRLVASLPTLIVVTIVGAWSYDKGTRRSPSA
jgi:hypothetical protein